jgi:hypothetical protein
MLDSQRQQEEYVLEIAHLNKGAGRRVRRRTRWTSQSHLADGPVRIQFEQSSMWPSGAVNEGWTGRGGEKKRAVRG